jgi:hypothetical protein
VHDFVLVGRHFRLFRDYVVLCHGCSLTRPAHTEADICSSILASSSSTTGTLPPTRP